MNFLQERFGRYFLKLRVKKTKRKLHVSTFDTAQNIAIIYDNSGTLSNGKPLYVNQKIKNFTQTIAGIHAETKITLLGFCSTTYTKQLHKTEVFSSEIFTKKDFTWYGTAKSETLEKFINTPFDMLIDLSVEQNFPLEYIVQLSKASFKIGRLNQSLLYDFMIDIKNEKNIDYLIQQISVYLPSLKQK
ncbi:MAG: hypothetical protein FWC39_10760 [Bacteroidetes bacterium]|nr:hypothetical protein [Bacteroidota bacterium]